MSQRAGQRGAADGRHRVFISYSTRDREKAERFCALVEERGVHCWMAPRDVVPGATYGSQIIQAIAEVDALVVLISASSVTSRHVSSEVARAFEKGKDIYPLRVEEVWPSDELELYVTSAHWIEGWNTGLDAAADTFVKALGNRPRSRGLPPQPAVKTTPYGWLLVLILLGALLAVAIPVSLVLIDPDRGPRLIEQLPPGLQGWAWQARLALSPPPAETLEPMPAPADKAAATHVEPLPPAAPPDPRETAAPGAVWKTGEPRIEFVWIEPLGVWIGRCEIANAQFQRFKPGHWSGRFHGEALDGDQQPVVRVSHIDAAMFAAWLTGREQERRQLPADWAFRLPTEDEWLACARCGDEREYPWGDAWPPTAGNYADETMGARPWAGETIGGYEDGFRVSAPIAMSGTNAWGLCGVGGNVWEYVRNTDDGKSVCRGGAWDSVQRENLACDAQATMPVDQGRHNVGFRLVLAPADGLTP